MTSPFGDPLATDTIGNPVDESGRPSSLGFWLGGLLIAAGIIGGALWIVAGLSNFSDAIDDFERVPVGQVGTVDLEAGDYIVYAERGGGLPQSSFISGIRMRPAGEGRGDEVEFEDYESEFTYDFGGRAGRAQLTFSIEDPGEYQVRIDDGPGTTATTAAFGPSVAGDLVSAIVGLFVIAGIGIVLGIILIVVTAIRRRKWRRRSWMDGAGGTPYGGNQPGVWNPGPAGAPPGAWGAPPPPGYAPPPPPGYAPPPPPGGGYPPPPG